MRKSNIEVTAFLAVAIIVWVFTRQALFFFVALTFLIAAGVGMWIYLFIKHDKMTHADSWDGFAAMVGWGVMAYALIHANGLTVWSLLS